MRTGRDCVFETQPSGVGVIAKVLLVKNTFLVRAEASRSIGLATTLSGELAIHKLDTLDASLGVGQEVSKERFRNVCLKARRRGGNSSYGERPG